MLRTTSITSALIGGSLTLAKLLFLAGEATNIIMKGPPYYMHAWLNVGIVLAVSAFAVSGILARFTSARSAR